MKTGIQLITEERQRQISEQGWTSHHDDCHIHGELRLAGQFYAMRGINAASEMPSGWPWQKKWWKPSDDEIHNLTKAGALFLAESDRFMRAGRDGAAATVAIYADKAAKEIDQLNEVEFQTDPLRKTPIHLLQCSKQRCGHVLLKTEQDKIPSRLWANATVSVCPKCGNESFYTLTAQGRCRTTKDRDLPLEINAEDIAPSPRMGLKMRRRLFAAKNRALGIPSKSSLQPDRP